MGIQSQNLQRGRRETICINGFEGILILFKNLKGFLSLENICSNYFLILNGEHSKGNEEMSMLWCINFRTLLDLKMENKSLEDF